jgi:hypothetical protein
MLWQNRAMSKPPDPASDRRQHARKADRAEMSLSSSRTYVSNLSLNGAFVSILSGLHRADSFAFELALDDFEEQPVRGRAVVMWTDPGVGAGVRFDLSDEERERLARYLEQLGVPPGPPESEAEEATYDIPRRSRRTVALGPDNPTGDTRVWFTYLQPKEPES